MLIAQRLEKLTAVYDDSRRTVALFLMRHTDEADALSMREVAEQTNTSKATLVRIAQQLGYSGWREFFDAWRLENSIQRERDTKVNHSVPFAAGASVSEVIDAVGRVTSESAWQTARIQDPETMEHAVEALASAGTIALFGISVNELCLRLFQRKMAQLGVMCVLPPQAEMGLFTQTLVEGDCAVLVSYTGETGQRSPMKYIEELRRRGVFVIGVTSEGPNYLREHADATLSIFSQESLYAKVGTISTEASITAVLDMLYASYFACDYQRNLEFKTRNSTAVETNRQPKAV